MTQRRIRIQCRDNSMAFLQIIPNNCLQRSEQCNTRTAECDAEAYGEAYFGDAKDGEAQGRRSLTIARSAKPDPRPAKPDPCKRNDKGRL